MTNALGRAPLGDSGGRQLKVVLAGQSVVRSGVLSVRPRLSRPVSATWRRLLIGATLSNREAFIARRPAQVAVGMRWRPSCCQARWELSLQGVGRFVVTTEGRDPVAACMRGRPGNVLGKSERAVSSCLDKRKER